MDIRELQRQALAIRDAYQTAHMREGRAPWDTADFLTGFTSDVGDLAKLIMARDGKRVIPNHEPQIGHELADCLWSVLVLAAELDVDLEHEFGELMSDLSATISVANPAAAGEDEPE